MASWTSPRASSTYRDASPTSPLTPLSPSALPQWLRRTRPRSVLTNGRIRLIAIACGCILLGWLMTAGLGPADDEDDLATHDFASGGVLTDPSGFGSQGERPRLQPGIIGESDVIVDAHDAQRAKKKPSVAGALTDLHSAVKDKLQQWTPYHVKFDQSTNSTSKDKHEATEVRANATLWDGESVTDGLTEEARLGAKVRIGKCTIVFNGNGYWERALRTHERHNKEHGYRLHVLRQPLMDDVWSKPAYILSLILRELAKPESERLDWLFWVDADTIILNPYIPIDVFLPPQDFDDIDLIYSNDWNGLNNGVFPIRVTSRAAVLFASIVSYRHFKPEDPLQFRDQSAMHTLMTDPEFVSHIVQAPQRWFNAYQGEHNETLAPYQIRRGDFLVHFAGFVGQGREERMGYWLERAEQHLDDWEVPVKSTSYPTEVRDFWNSQRELRRDKEKKLVETRLEATRLIDRIDQEMIDFGDRLEAEQNLRVSESMKELVRILGHEHLSLDQTALDEAVADLQKQAAPLTIAKEDAHKLLLTAAHQTIFAAEKDLIDGRFNEGNATPQLTRVSVMVNQLKGLVMSPPDTWNRQSLISATNQVTDARAALQAKNAEVAKSHVDALASAQGQAQVDVEAQAAALAFQAGAARGAAVMGMAVDEPLNSAATQAAPAITVVATQVVAAPQVVVTTPGEAVVVTPVPVVVWTTATTVVSAPIEVLGEAALPSLPEVPLDAREALDPNK